MADKRWSTSDGGDSLLVVGAVEMTTCPQRHIAQKTQRSYKMEKNIINLSSIVLFTNSRRIR